jgi:GTP cyclohydrolase I
MDYATNPVEVAEAEDLFKQFMIRVGLDPERDEHMKDTPARFTKMICEATANYRVNPSYTKRPHYDSARQIKATTYAAGQADSLVVVDNISFSSICAHHLLPFMGVAHVGYIPGKEIIGLSKFARVVDFFCRRPQTQEFLTEQIAHELGELLRPKFLAVMMEAEHTCMSCRGPRKLGAKTITSKFTPRKMVETKDEFLRLVCRRS